MTRERAQEHDDALSNEIVLRLAQPAPRGGAAIEVPLVYPEELLHVLRAVKVDHRAAAGHRRVAHELVLVAQDFRQERRHEREVARSERRRDGDGARDRRHHA